MKRLTILLLIVIATAHIAVAKPKSPSLWVGSLKVEQMSSPMGIDARHPRLSWVIGSTLNDVRQTAYEIIVASSAEKLAKDEGDIWSSGKVESDSSVLVGYKGAPLKSNQRCYWKVRVYTTKGNTPWSTPSMWSMGLLTENDWTSRWIGLDRAMGWESETQWSRLAARYLRKEFKLKEGKTMKQATLHICGLGMYEAFINGQKVGDRVLNPMPTDYRRTVLYNSYDVTGLLKQSNAIGVTLGNGRFYTMRQNYKPYKITNFGYPKMRLMLIVEYSDGTTERIGSDERWKLFCKGPILSNNEYDGEDYDANREMPGWSEPGFDDKEWMKAQRVSIPYGTLRASMAPGMKVMEQIKPQRVFKARRGNGYIIDMGQNMAGWLKIKVQSAAKGDTIRLRFAETLQKDSSLYIANLRDAKCTDTYVANGKEKGREWSPTFVYHGFRFVEVTGLKYAPQAADFTGEVIYDEMNVIGNFACDNDVLNQIYKNAFWGIRSNYKGMPVDCPQRNERQPWLGDRTKGSLGESFIFDNAALYTKWMDDIREAQREDGCIPDVAPAFWNYYSDNVTWPAAFFFGCEMLYNQFGNKQPIIENYAAMKKWMQHISSTYTKNGLITRDKYGDWCVPPEKLNLIHSEDPSRITDGTLISSAYYIGLLKMMSRFAKMQNLNDEAQLYLKQANQMAEVFNSTFLKVKKGMTLRPGHPLYPDSIYYSNNTVTANLLPVAFGIVPSEYEDEVVKNISATTLNKHKGVGQIECGVIGVQWILQQLCQHGRSDLAFRLASNDDYPSWGYMAKQGATTIWELWNGNTADPKMNSGNHVMLLGDLIPFLYQNLAGIRATEPAYHHIDLRPQTDIENLSKVDCSYSTPYGEVVSKWHKNLQKMHWQVTVPCNTTATIHLPDGRTDEVGSGTHTFDISLPKINEAVTCSEFLYEKAPFRECHAATVAETPKGDLVATFFGGTKERNPDVCIWVCRKPKGSDKWTEPQLVADGKYSAVTKSAFHETDSVTRKACWNPVIFQVPKGDLLLFYKIGLNVKDWTGFVTRSKDGGKTWQTPQALPEGFLGPIKNKPVMVGDKIYCPSSTENKGWRLHFEVTDKKLTKWQKIGPLEAELSLPTAVRKSPVTTKDALGNNKNDQEAGEAIKTAKPQPILAIQPSIMFLKDGRLKVLARTRNANLATAESRDKGKTWSKVTLSDLPNNNSGTDAVTLKDGRQMLIYNDFSTIDGTPKGPRTPLSLAISDDGEHWRKLMDLETSPVSQYSYPSIIQGSDGKVYCIYTWRRRRIKFVEIDLNKLK